MLPGSQLFRLMQEGGVEWPLGAGGASLSVCHELCGAENVSLGPQSALLQPSVHLRQVQHMCRGTWWVD